MPDVTDTAPLQTIRSSEPVVFEAEQVDFAYGSVQVLFGVSVAVARGEALALLGTNGAGKSTLLKVMCGLARPSAGKVRLEGHDVTGRPAEWLVERGVALVAGGRGVFRDMTVLENLDVGLYSLRRQPALARSRRDGVLDLFPRLRERIGQQAGNLSGGEQQQLALAKAFSLEPAVLCIDELSLGLAPVLVESLLAAVRSILATGVTLVLVEQSLNVAASMCPRAVFLEKGQVRFEGRTQDLLDRSDIARAVFFGADGTDATGVRNGGAA